MVTITRRRPLSRRPSTSTENEPSHDETDDQYYGRYPYGYGYGYEYDYEYYSHDVVDSEGDSQAATVDVDGVQLVELGRGLAGAIRAAEITQSVQAQVEDLRLQLSQFWSRVDLQQWALSASQSVATMMQSHDAELGLADAQCLPVRIRSGRCHPTQPARHVGRNALDDRMIHGATSRRKVPTRRCPSSFTVTLCPCCLLPHVI